MFSIISISINAQKLDSLHTLLQGLPNNEQKLPVMHEIWKEYVSDSIEQAIYYASEEKELALTLKNDHWLARAYFSLGYLYDKQGYLGKAVENYVYAIELFKSQRDHKRLADVYYNLADLFLIAEDYVNARLYFKECLKFRERQKSDDFLSWIHLSIGQAEAGLQRYEQAIEAYEKALIEAKRMNDNYAINFLYTSIGALYQEQQHYNLARDNFYKSIEIEGSKKINIAIACNNIGETYLEEGNTAEAKRYFYKSLSIKDSLKAHDAKAITYLNIGKMFTSIGDYTSAKENLNKAIDLAKLDKIDRGAIEALSVLNEIHNLEASNNVYPSGQEMLKYENIQTKQIALINDLNDELAPLKNRYLLQVNYEVPMLSTQLSRAITSKNINSKLAIIAGILALITIGFMAYYMRKVFVARRMLSKF